MNDELCHPEDMVTESPEPNILPEPNFEMYMGDGPYNFCFQYRVNKTLRNRIKYWLFCQFFPFKIKRWDKEITCSGK